MDRNGRDGVVLIFAAGMMFVLLAFVGLAFDVGFLQWSRRRAQTAADAAAVSAAWAIQAGGSAATDGKKASKVNGFEDGVNAVTVTISNPPSSGSYATDGSAVEAVVSQDAPSYFIRVLGFNNLPVRARAVARQGYGTGCIYALNPTAKSALKFEGNVNVALGCGAIVESNNTEATTVGGNAVITMNNSASIGSVGGYKLQNGATLTPANSLNSGVISPGDPLASLPMPTYTSQQCFNGTTMVTGPCTASTNLASGSYQPGVYCGGININSGVSVNFAAGTYIIAGGIGLNVASGTVTANNVTFYITDTTGWPCSGINGNSVYPGPVSVNSQAVFTLTAPTSGTYAGIAIFENRGIAADHLSNNNINGGSGLTINGALYFPNSLLSFSGSSDAEGYLLLIADTVDFTGNATFSLNNFPPEFAGNNPAFKKWTVLAE